MPEPKVRSRARYTLVIINESGRSRQIDLTPLKLRLTLAAVVGVLVLMVAGGFSVGRVLSGNAGLTTQEKAAIQRMGALQDELPKNEVALAVLPKRSTEIREASTPVAVTPPRGAGSVQEDEESEPAETPRQIGPRGSMISAMNGSADEEERPETGRTIENRTERPRNLSEAEPPPRRMAAAQPSRPQAPVRSQTESATTALPVMNFDAEEVSAAPEGPNRGKLSFRLVKDRKDVRFTGYLFVYVEMAGERGETKLYAYPKKTNRGEGDLPADYREGEMVAFKSNTEVSLDYGDPRPSASLAGLTVLLYGEDGRIVFQRGFGKNEVKTVTPSAKPQGSKPQSSTRRRAL